MPSRNLSHLAARSAGGLCKSEQRADLFDAESKFTSAADEGQPSNVPLFIGAMPARRPGGDWHELDALVIAHGFEVDARRARELSDRQGHFFACTCSRYGVQDSRTIEENQP